jgi:glycosyltransferase involved in cell wall biosynthesis
VLVLAASDQGKPYRQQHGRLLILRMQSYPNPQRVNQRFLLWPANEIRSALQDFSPDVIHLNEPFQMAYFARLYAQGADIPCILTIHALPTLVYAETPGMSGIHQFIEKGLWGYAAWLTQQFEAEITPTATIAKEIAGRTGYRPTVISGGVDLKTFKPGALPPDEEAALRDALGVPGNAQVILHVGRLDAGKNVRTIVEAAALSMRSLPAKDVHLVVVGDGCQKTSLIEQARELGIAEKCHFPGFVREPERLSAIYRMADLFSMASEIETQGLVLLEAAACGLPIVAVRATAVPEIVRDGINGFLVEPGDVALMAECMSAILQDTELAERLSLESRQASLVHDFTRTVDAYEASYQAAILKRKIRFLEDKVDVKEVPGV